jgi:hypothetical protein
MNVGIEFRRLARHIVVAFALGWGLSSPASALTVPTGASVADLAAAVAADGLGADRLAGQAKSLLTQGVSAGDVVQALLVAGYGTVDVVREVLVQGVLAMPETVTGAAIQIAADALLREVATRVFFLQGPSVLGIVREAVLAARERLIEIGKLPRDGDDASLDRLLTMSQAAAAAAAAEGLTWQGATSAGGGEASAR